MAKQDWFDDYMDYKLSGCEEEDEGASASDGGCLPALLGILLVFWFLFVLIR